MAWRRPGDKSLSELMMVSLLTHICVTRPQWVNVEFVIFMVCYPVTCICWFIIGLNHWCWVMHIWVIEHGHHWFSFIINWTFRNKPERNFNQKSKIFIETNAFENGVCEMVSILSQPQCVKHTVLLLWVMRLFSEMLMSYHWIPDWMMFGEYSIKKKNVGAVYNIIIVPFNDMIKCGLIITHSNFS